MSYNYLNNKNNGPISQQTTRVENKGLFNKNFTQNIKL